MRGRGGGSFYVGSRSAVFRIHETTRSSAGSIGGQFLGGEFSGRPRPLYRRCAILFHAPAAVLRPIFVFAVISALLGRDTKRGGFSSSRSDVLRLSRSS